jgi:putative nucleotidyltransferase with HDIG domain
MCTLHDPQEAATKPLDPTAVVDELVVALSNARIYRPDHPRVTAAVATLVSGLECWFETKGAERFDLGVADGFLFHARRPLLGASLSASRLVDPLSRLSSGGISFLRGAAARDVLALVALLGARRHDARSHAEANLALDQQGASKVRLLPPYRAGVDGLAAPQTGADLEQVEAALAHLLEVTPREVYQSTVETLQDATVDAVRGSALDLDSLRGVAEKLQQRMLADPATMLGLTRYERYDEFTFGHSIRVAALALQFGSTLTRDTELLNRIGLAALLHDIGKSRVPFDILHARRRLDPAERRIMSRHTELGAEVLLETGEADPLAVTVAFGHHRAEEGQGYPLTTDGAPLCLATRLIKLCDVYEALTAVRPYKPRMSPIRAYRIMMGMQGQFDPALLRRFIEVNGAYPVGQRVRLASGEVARVRRQTEEVLKPLVELEPTTLAGARAGRAQERDLRSADDEGHTVAELLLDDAA